MLAYDSNGRPLIILKEQNQEKPRIKGIAATKVFFAFLSIKTLVLIF